jgi:hypothetical protein
MSDPGVVNSKNFDIKVLDLINSGGQTVDLRKIFVELQIFQDIYSTVMSGNIVIEDGHDIFSNFYFCGNEFIQISIDKPTLDKPLEKIFRIYKTTNRAPSSDSGQIYIFHFCSEEMIHSNSKLVSKGYKSQKTSDIVLDILANELKLDPSKLGVIEQTSGIHDLIVPGYRPFEAIQWVTSRSYDASNKFCYFFYENRDGYNFRSYNSLIKQSSYKTLKYEIKTVEQDPAVNRDSIDKFKIINDFDIINSLTNGAFSSRLLSIDLFDQSFEFNDYSINDVELAGNLLNQYKPINQLKNADNRPITQCFDSYFLAYIKQPDNSPNRENQLNKWLMQRTLQMALMHNFKIEIVIPGDILLKAGDVVEYEFPKFEAGSKEGKTLDEYRTGKYIVSAVNHKFTGRDAESFESVVELVSDSVSKQIPAAKEGLNKVVKKVQ